MMKSGLLVFLAVFLAACSPMPMATDGSRPTSTHTPPITAPRIPSLTTIVLDLTSTCVPPPTIAPTLHPTATPTKTPTPKPPPTMVRLGTLANNETWSGIVQVNGDVVVPQGVTLTIEPGTTVRFAHNRETKTLLTWENYLSWPKPALIVYGTLLAVGSPDRLIIFTSDAPDPRGGDWRGIIISVESSKSASRSVISYSIIEYASKSILFHRGAGINHLVENNILRFANQAFKLNPGASLFNGGGAGICKVDASLPIIRGNIIYGNVAGIDIQNAWPGSPIIENNIVCFNQQPFFGWANGVFAGGSKDVNEVTPIFRNNLICWNQWGMEFNWGSKAIVENNLITSNDVGLVVCQDDPGELESFPTCRFNDVWGNGVNYLHQRFGQKHSEPPERFGSDNISIDPHFSEQDFYNANFNFAQPGLKDSGNPDLVDADGSRSDIGPNWDWSWVNSTLLVPPK